MNPQDLSTEDLYKGSLFASTQQIESIAQENDEVLRAPDPSEFVNAGAAPGLPSVEVTQIHKLAMQVMSVYDRLRETSPTSTDDDLRDRMLPMPCGKLAEMNETLYALCTSRDHVSMRDKFVATLLVRAQLEAGEISSEEAKIKLSDLMGVDHAARSRLRMALEKES